MSGPPSQSANEHLPPGAPKMSDTTEDSLIWASSRSFSTRFFSAVRTTTRLAR
jgi:hypothetical protein